MTTDTVLKQVRDRLGPLNGQAEQAVAEAVEIIRQMSERPSSPITEDSFKGENVSLDEYESWSEDQQAQYLAEAKKANATWIEKRLQDLGAAWMIVVEGKIIAHGPTLQTLPHDEEFDALCEKYGKFPFVFFSPRLFLIEETALCHSTTTPGDAYPTIWISLKADKVGTALEADFDTGAFDAYFNLDLLTQSGVIKAKKRTVYDESAHLGKNFRYTTQSLTLEIKDKSDQYRQAKIVAVCVKNWNNSPFVTINPNRTALVGRNAISKLRPIVSLDFANHQTEVEYRAPLS
ncbi:hypothetical protein L0337_02290 [candidate division KSB1 bacterium]|nr:hypothetical protein [candidate division KSB1 bacterium]